MIRNINVSANDKLLKEYSISSKNITLEELIKKINRKIAQKAFSELKKISKKENLKKITMKEINEEIKAYRDEKKARNRH